MRKRAVPQTPLLADHYSLTMAYTWWKNNRHECNAVFDYIIRECPFGGEFAIFAGLGDLLDFVDGLKYTEEDLNYVEKIAIPGCDPEFYNWLSGFNTLKTKIYSLKEGSAAFPYIPMIRVEGPIAISQILEASILYLNNFPSLITTNAVRYRMAAGKGKVLYEFGLRRAQNAIQGSYYAWIGGFDSTSNMFSARDLDIASKGTMAHSLIESFSGLEELSSFNIEDSKGKERNFVEMVLKYQKELGFEHTNKGELTAFIAYAQAWPKGFLALIDTYSIFDSGIPNFLCVAMALWECGYKPIGIRIDSEDLAYVSRKARKIFMKIDDKYDNNFTSLNIVGSNNIDEKTLYSLREQDHQFDTLGIGTRFITCRGNSDFGGVYKLVSLDGKPRMKLSDSKVTIPGQKEAYRLIGSDGKAILDLMTLVGSSVPKAGERIFCRNPFKEREAAYVTPKAVIPLHQLVWDGKRIINESPATIKNFVKNQTPLLREDHLRNLNPTPYKVSVTDELYQLMHDLWKKETLIGELK